MFPCHAMSQRINKKPILERMKFNVRILDPLRNQCKFRSLRRNSKRVFSFEDHIWIENRRWMHLPARRLIIFRCDKKCFFSLPAYHRFATRTARDWSLCSCGSCSRVSPKHPLTCQEHSGQVRAGEDGPETFPNKERLLAGPLRPLPVGGDFFEFTQYTVLKYAIVFS